MPETETRGFRIEYVGPGSTEPIELWPRGSHIPLYSTKGSAVARVRAEVDFHNTHVDQFGPSTFLRVPRVGRISDSDFRITPCTWTRADTGPSFPPTTRRELSPHVADTDAPGKPV